MSGSGSSLLRLPLSCLLLHLSARFAMSYSEGVLRTVRRTQIRSQIGSGRSTGVGDRGAASTRHVRMSGFSSLVLTSFHHASCMTPEAVGHPAPSMRALALIQEPPDRRIVTHARRAAFRRNDMAGAAGPRTGDAKDELAMGILQRTDRDGTR